MILASASGSTIRGSGSLIGGRWGSDIRVGGRTSGIISSVDSGSVALSRADNGGTCFQGLRYNDSLWQDTR